MLTLITGGPGNGKTALVVSMLQEVRDREIWVSGIPELQVPHRELDHPDKWPEVVPDGAIIVIDEVQRLWRPRAPGSKVPDHVAQLETHRHRGLDFIVLTQGPNLLDANVRALVGRHIHLRDLGVLGRRWYEWPECADNVRTGWRSAPIKRRYKLPKAVFSRYKSASEHHKPERAFPVALAVAGAAVVLVFGLGWKVYGNIRAKASGETEVSSPTESPKAPPSPGVSSPTVIPVRSAPDERVDFDPRISDRPWTAKAYDEVRMIVRMPTIGGAICVNAVCKCYAVGGGYLPDVSSKACEQWADERPFNPYFSGGETVGQPQQVSYGQPENQNQRPMGAARGAGF